jgi:hypothetical protein
LSELGLGLGKEVLAGVLLFGLSRLELVSGGVADVTLLRLVGSSWEEDELALEAFESLNIELKSLFGSVESSVVNSDADSSGEVRADFSLGKFLKTETSSIS